MNDLLLGTERAWKALGQNSIGVSSFGGETPEYLHGFALYETAALIGAGAFAAIFLALAYLTFFHRWQDTET